MAIASVAISVSTHPLLWVFLPFGLLVLLVLPLLERLSQPATPRFTLMVAMAAWLFTVPHGPLSLFSGGAGLREASAWITVSALIVLGIAYTERTRSGRRRIVIWTLVFVWVVLAGATAILADPETWIDVWALHHGAGEALINGTSPYSTLSVPNPMSQFPAGSVYEGYVYPPIPLFTLALTDALAGDSRWFLVLCGLALVWVLRRLSTSPETEAVSILFLVTPGWPLMVQLSWTEPLSILILALAMVGQPGSRARSVLTGAFIASKQYLVMTALPVLVSWVRSRRAALVTAGASAVLLYAVGLLFGPSQYVEWVFIFFLQVPPPPVAENLPGLAERLLGIDFSIPTAITLIAALLAGAWVAWRKPRSDASMLLGMATTMTVAFLFGYQAFPNYWYGALGVFILGILTRSRDDKPPEKPLPVITRPDSLRRS